MKVRSCVKLFDFFRGWILICLTWILSRFVPNSVEILMWNFRKNCFGRIFQKFLRKLMFHYRNLWNFALLSAMFILRPYYAEKIHTSTFICFLHPGKEARPLMNHTKKIRGRNARTFCFRKTSFVHSRSGTYYALFFGCFGLKSLPDVRHCVY